LFKKEIVENNNPRTRINIVSSLIIFDSQFAFIRAMITEMYDEETANSVRILYGGSVNPGNIKEFMAKENIDGALVGSASLDAKKFGEIVKICEVLSK